MLSYDSLLIHSKERELPSGKLRAAACEYLQVLVLKALYGQREAKGLVFVGGTALRLGYDLPRFSEDLDFDAEKFSFREWKKVMQETAHILSRQGLTVEARAAEKGSLLTGDLRCEGFLQTYRLTESPAEKLRIKMEANRPGYPLMAEPRVVSGYGEMIPISFAAPGLMAAEKILCVLSRSLGRDVYDLFFMAGKKWKPDRRVLQARGVRKSVADVIVQRVEAFSSKQLKEMARRIEPFLFDPGQVNLVADAHRLLPSALEYLRS